MCRFKETQTWTLPLVNIFNRELAHKELLEFVHNTFKGVQDVISIINVAEKTVVVPRKEHPTEDEQVTTYLYDVETTGQITPGLYSSFDAVRWTVPAYITAATKINRPTLAVRLLMENKHA